MAKHYSKRASRKRRIIRKLKTTLRRKTQKGGNVMVIKLLMIILSLVLASNPKLMSLLELFAGVSSNSRRGGAVKKGNRLQQRGGENTRLLGLLNKLNESYDNGNALSDLNDQVSFRNCIQTLRAQMEANTFDIPTTTPNQPEEVIDSSTLSELVPDSEKSPAATEEIRVDDTNSVKLFIKNKITTIKDALDRKLEKQLDGIKTKYNIEDVTCFRTLKDIVLRDLVAQKDAFVEKGMKLPAVERALKAGNSALEIFKSRNPFGKPPNAY